MGGKNLENLKNFQKLISGGGRLLRTKEYLNYYKSKDLFVSSGSIKSFLFGFLLNYYNFCVNSLFASLWYESMFKLGGPQIEVSCFAIIFERLQLKPDFVFSKTGNNSAFSIYPNYNSNTFNNAPIWIYISQTLNILTILLQVVFTKDYHSVNYKKPWYYGGYNLIFGYSLLRVLHYFLGQRYLHWISWKISGQLLFTSIFTIITIQAKAMPLDTEWWYFSYSYYLEGWNCSLSVFSNTSILTQFGAFTSQFWMPRK